MTETEVIRHGSEENRQEEEGHQEGEGRRDTSSLVAPVSAPRPTETRTRRANGLNVRERAVQRLADLYADGHRLIISVSGGKDSTVVLNLAIEAATMTGRLPVEVVTRDEEIAFPGTYELLGRIHDMPDVSMRWINHHQQALNVFDRNNPYWWVFDRTMKPEEWMRLPPPYAEEDIGTILSMVVPSRYPTNPGQELIAVIGIRVTESTARRYGIHSAGGHLTKPNEYGVRKCFPIFDMLDGDVWKCILDGKWDYNEAYDVMRKMGLPKSEMRIGPPISTLMGIRQLEVAHRAWPKWFDRLSRRVQGVRSGAMFGLAAVTPHRKPGETWKECYYRECVKEAPEWIAERAIIVADKMQAAHARHSSAPFREMTYCPTCGSTVACWKKLAEVMYNGDPVTTRTQGFLERVPPEFFRPGAGGFVD